jgi:hypothetical protein
MKLEKDNIRERAPNIQEKSPMILADPGAGIFIEVAIQANQTSKTAKWMTVEQGGLVMERSSDLEDVHQRNRD